MSLKQPLFMHLSPVVASFEIIILRLDADAVSGML
jgi:hypothetical protein